MAHVNVGSPIQGMELTVCKMISNMQRRIIKGFSLIELVVAASVFSIAIMIATGSLIQAQSLSVRFRDNQFAFTGLASLIETVTRDLRYGTNLRCGNLDEINYNLNRNCSFQIGAQGSPSIVFDSYLSNSNVVRTEYSLLNGAVVIRERLNDNSISIKRLSGSDIVVEELKFFVDGALTWNASYNEPGSGYDSMQPRIVMYVKGKTLPGSSRNSSVPFAIETAISARGIDN